MIFDVLETCTFVEEANVGVALPEPPGVFIMPLSPPCWNVRCPATFGLSPDVPGPIPEAARAD